MFNIVSNFSVENIKFKKLTRGIKNQKKCFLACVSPQMAQVEERLVAAAPAAPLTLPPPVDSRPRPARPSEESSDDSSDRRKKEKKEKKTKKREKRERREREGS